MSRPQSGKGFSPGKDEDLGNLNVIHKLTLPQNVESKYKAKKSRGEMPKKMEQGTCLNLASGGKGHSCHGRSCVRIQSFQKGDWDTWFGDVAEKEKSEVQI